MRKLLLLTLFMMLLIPVSVSASEPEDEDTKPSLSGNIVISYSTGSGKFDVEHSGGSEELKHATYTWYKGSSSVSTLEDYKPTSTGTYYCVLTNDDYSGQLKSGEITLYQAKGKSDMTFNNEYGLYMKGATVTARVKLEAGEKVTGWTTNVKGVAVPSSGNPVTFIMPAQDITITPTISKTFAIKISGGTADKYIAMPGEIITIRANKVKGETFSNWKISGGTIDDKESKNTTFKMPSSDVTIEAEYKSDKEKKSSSSSSTTSSSSSKATPSASDKTASAVNAVFEVLNDGGFKIDVRHARQGPLCDRAFRSAQGRDWLVTDYFNITVNGSYDVYELPSPIRIKLSIPPDLRKSGRSWRMLCISRGGLPYSFLDEDNDDDTITFSPDRFYAYAMVFNDNGFAEEEPPVAEPTETTTEEPSEAPVDATPTETSSSHNVEDSQTMTSVTHGVEESKTYTGEADESSAPAAMKTGTLNMDSDKKYTIINARGTKIPIFQI